MMAYLENFAGMYIEMAYYMVIGLTMVALMKIFLNANIISKYVGDDSFRSILFASAIGVPLPLCSCSVLPTAIELKKSGAGIGVTTSFLISTPQVGVGSIIASYGMMGPFIAIYRAIAAFLSGVIGGLISGRINRNIIIKEAEVKNCCEHSHEEASCNSDMIEGKSEEISCSCGHSHEEEKKGVRRLFSAIKYAFVDFVDDISLHFIVGVAIAALISTIIPNEFFHNLGLTNGLLIMLLMILIGLPMYICSTSSIPIAIALILKGISPGAAFVFLFVGPATNIASLLLLGKTLGKKATITYVVSVIILAVSFGLLMDLIIEMFNINLDFIGQHMHGSSSIFMQIVAVLFAIVLILSLIRKARRKFVKAS